MMKNLLLLLFITISFNFFAQNISISNTTVSPVICAGSDDGAITFTVSDFTDDYTYTVNGGASISGQSSTEITLTNLSPGNYTIEVTDDITNETDSILVTVTEPDFLELTITATNVSCNGNSDGEVYLNATGGTPPYQYNHNGGAYQTFDSFFNLPAGGHAFSVLDSNGCIVTLDWGIGEPDVLSATIDVVDSGNEPSGKIIITESGGTPPYQYSIDGGIVYTSNNVFTDLNSGNYDVSILDVNACVYTNTVTIDEINVNNSITKNSQNQLSVSLSGVISYQWINVDTNTRIPGANTDSYTPTESGNYQVEMVIDDGVSSKNSLINNSAKALQTVLSPVIEVTVSSLSINDIDDHSFKIYPNPATSSITYSNTLVGEHYKIYNLLGREVGKGEMTQALSVSSLANGVYILKVDSYKPIKFIKE